MVLVMYTPVLAQWCARCPDVTQSVHLRKCLAYSSTHTMHATIMHVEDYCCALIPHPLHKFLQPLIEEGNGHPCVVVVRKLSIHLDVGALKAF